MRQTVLSAAALLIVLSFASAQPTPERQAQIDALIKQLGDVDGKKRDEASRKLEEMGPDALSALEAATKSDDPEIRIRAREVYRKLTNPSPEQLKQARLALDKALAEGDFDRLAASGYLLSVAKRATPADMLWLGHSRQLSGRWKDAVEAYLAALHRLEVDAAVAEGRARTAHASARVSLALSIARIQRYELNDPKAAAKTLGSIRPLFDSDRGDHWLDVLSELASACEASGDLAGALKAWDARRSFWLRDPYKYRSHRGVDMNAVDRLLHRAEADHPLPEVPWLITLTPDEPAFTLVPDDAKTRGRSYHHSAINPDGPYWRWAFIAPPGKELATLECACDIELSRRGARQFLLCSCEESPGRARVLGKIDWPRDKPPGREVFRATFEVPPGTRVVDVMGGSHKDRFTMHRVDLKATFRDAKPTPEPPALEFADRVQTEFLPERAKAMLGDQSLHARAMSRKVRPGRYRLRYAIPGREDAFEADVVIEAGKRYSFFANLDSPFRWTPLQAEGAWGGWVNHSSVAPLPDGSLLAFWIDEDHRLLLSRTKDGKTWTKAQRAPFGSVFPARCPTLFAAKDGTVWAAWSSSRLDLVPGEKPLYRLWLTSTRDGVNWTALRSPVMQVFPYWQNTGIQMLEDRKGNAWIFAARSAGSAKSFSEIRELKPMELTGDELPLNLSVALDDDGRFHMAYCQTHVGIRYITSADGMRWSAPRTLVEGTGSFPSSHPRLLIEGDKALLIYTNEGGWLTPVRFDAEPLKSRTGLKVIGKHMSASPLTRTRDGEVLMIAGADNRWLVRAKVADLFKACGEKGE